MESANKPTRPTETDAQLAPVEFELPTYQIPEFTTGNEPRPQIEEPTLAIDSLRTVAASEPRVVSRLEAARQRRHQRMNAEPFDHTKPGANMSEYLREIGRTPLLTKEQEVELSQTMDRGKSAKDKLTAGQEQLSELERQDLEQKIQEGQAARTKFIKANLLLVVSIAKRFPVPQGAELMDLVQEGNTGLETAVDKFRWEKGFKFSTYGSWWIRQSISRGLMQNSRLIHLPSDIEADLRSNQILRSKGEEPEPSQKLQEAEQIATVIYGDKPITDEGTTSRLDMVQAPGPSVEQRVLGNDHDIDLGRLVGDLPEKLRQVITLNMGLGDTDRKNYRETAEILGISPERVRQLVNQATERMRQAALDSDLYKIDE